MKITLKPEQENLIKTQVASGKYNSPQEIVDKMFIMWERLEDNYDQIENKLDLQEALLILTEAKEKGEEPMLWEDFEEEFNSSEISN